MNGWAKTLPVVTVPEGAPKPRVTLVLPFYENHRFLMDQIASWFEWDEALRWHWSAVIVDDGSPTPARLPKALPFPVRLFRIEQDVRWNWLAARNIGAHHADPGWLLLTDMDHLVPPSTAHAVVAGQHDPDTIYAFSRQEHTGQAIPPHSASFLMTRALFWRVGGYDEALSGHYGTDGDWRQRCAAVAPIQVLASRLERYEYVADSSTTRYGRKEPIDRAVQALIAARAASWAPRTLSFPYHEVTR